jgi:hypothetical protein
MSNRGSFFLRALGALVLIGVLAAGGALLFQAGQAQGYQMGVTAASSATGGETQGATPLVPYGPAYWPYYARPHFGFFPFGWLCGSILMVFLALFALRLVLWPRRWYHHGKGPGDWGDHPHPWGPPPWMREQPRPEAGQGGAKPPDQPASETAT